MIRNSYHKKKTCLIVGTINSPNMILSGKICLAVLLAYSPLGNCAKTLGLGGLAGWLSPLSETLTAVYADPDAAIADLADCPHTPANQHIIAVTIH